MQQTITNAEDLDDHFAASSPALSLRCFLLTLL